MSVPQSLKVKLVVCSPGSGASKVVTDFIAQMRQANITTFSAVDTFTDIFSHIDDFEASVVMLSLADKDELLGALQFLASIEARVSNGTIRVVAMVKSDHPRIIALLKSKGVSEIYEHTISSKAFQHKIKQQVQAMLQSLEQGKSDSGVAKFTGGMRSADSQRMLEVHWNEAIEHSSDFWINLNPKHIRFAVGRWLINFFGPGPIEGTWESTTLELDGEQGWAFKPRNEGSAFHSNTGHWLFFGNCPEFSWEMKLWFFTSKKPMLAFYENEKIVFQKVWMKDQGIQAAKNTEPTLSWTEKIQNSIEASIRIQSEHFRSSKTQIDLDRDSVGKNYRVEFEPSDLQKAKNSYDRAIVNLAIASKNGVRERHEVGIELIELREKQAILTVPADLLMKGDSIELEAQFKKGQATAKVTFMAKTRVIEIEEGQKDHSPESAAAVCELDHNIETHFKELVDVFRQRRQDLLDFFFNAKGA